MRGTLDDSEERLAERGHPARIVCALSHGRATAPLVGATLQLFEGLFRSPGPTQRQLHAALRLFMRRFTRRTFIESHRDLCAEDRLYFHRNLWRQETQRAIDVRTKLSPFFSD